MKKLKLLTMDEIEHEEINWLWKPYIALGKICLVQGDPGIGKSTAVLALAADVTNGRVFGETNITEPSSVIYQTAEDGYADTVKPRLQRLSADCKRVHVIDESEYPLSISDDRIEAAIIESNAKLFIADPLQGFCKGTDIHSVNGIRPLMKRLGGVAERTGCAVVLITHLNKKGGQSQYRSLGSIDIYAAARSVLTVGKLPLDQNMRAIVHTKSNLAALGKSQAFGLDEHGGFCWLGDCDITTDEILSSKPKAENRFAKARRLLEQTLAHGPVLAVEIMQLAEEEGISFKTFKRAKDALGVISVKRGGQWYWNLPVDVVYEDDINDDQSKQEKQNEQYGYEVQGGDYSQEGRDEQGVQAADLVSLTY
jgi:hypothetical protein